jgi:hypothetical protein
MAIASLSALLAIALESSRAEAQGVVPEIKKDLGSGIRLWRAEIFFSIREISASDIDSNSSGILPPAEIWVPALMMSVCSSLISEERPRSLE